MNKSLSTEIMESIHFANLTTIAELLDASHCELLGNEVRKSILGITEICNAHTDE